MIKCHCVLGRFAFFYEIKETILLRLTVWQDGSGHEFYSIGPAQTSLPIGWANVLTVATLAELKARRGETLE
jgi:hypothetical protein